MADPTQNNVQEQSPKVQGPGGLWFREFDNVPILDEHWTSNDNGEKRYIGPKELNQIATNNNKREHLTGDLCPIIIGHTKDGAAEKSQPPVVGFAKNFKVGPFRNTGKQAIFADFLIMDHKLDEAKEYMRRSVELWLDRMEIDPIALLGATTPERDLGLLLMYKRKMAGRHYRRMSPDDLEGEDMADDLSSLGGEQSNEARGVAQQVLEMLQQTPVFKLLSDPKTQQALVALTQQAGEQSPEGSGQEDPNAMQGQSEDDISHMVGDEGGEQDPNQMDDSGPSEQTEPDGDEGAQQYEYEGDEAYPDDYMHEDPHIMGNPSGMDYHNFDDLFADDSLDEESHGMSSGHTPVRMDGMGGGGSGGGMNGGYGNCGPNSGYIPSTGGAMNGQVKKRPMPKQNSRIGNGTPKGATNRLAETQKDVQIKKLQEQVKALEIAVNKSQKAEQYSRREKEINNFLVVDGLDINAAELFAETKDLPEPEYARLIKNVVKNARKDITKVKSIDPGRVVAEPNQQKLTGFEMSEVTKIMHTEKCDFATASQKYMRQRGNRTNG